ncbi:hypothetical protein KCP73_08045 [Salmonella enterica subsp. enterica]|nr:hypothetical protein KCP73_08045 [Salmonella enterica subsp. enterica]
MKSKGPSGFDPPYVPGWAGTVTVCLSSRKSSRSSVSRARNSPPAEFRAMPRICRYAG